MKLLILGFLTRKINDTLFPLVNLLPEVTNGLTSQLNFDLKWGTDDWLDQPLALFVFNRELKVLIYSNTITYKYKTIICIH